MGAAGFSRPITVVDKNLRVLKLSLKKPDSTCGYMLTGTQTCSALPNVNAPLNPRGATPITVYDVAFNVRTLPITPGLEPNLFVHRA